MRWSEEVLTTSISWSSHVSKLRSRIDRYPVLPSVEADSMQRMKRLRCTCVVGVGVGVGVGN